MMAYELKNIAILNAKGVDYKCTLRGISRDEAVYLRHQRNKEDFTKPEDL